MKTEMHNVLRTLTASMQRAAWDRQETNIGGGIFSAQEMRDATLALREMRNENLQLIGMLQRLYAGYKALADSGDAGNWRLEETQIGQDVLALLREVSA